MKRISQGIINGTNQDNVITLAHMSRLAEQAQESPLVLKKFLELVQKEKTHQHR
jgi:hypothetical protein